MIEFFLEDVVMSVQDVRVRMNYESRSVRLLWDENVGSDWMPISNPGVELLSPEECEQYQDLIACLSEDEQIALQYFWLDVGKVRFAE